MLPTAKAATVTPTQTARSQVRIALFLSRSTRMGDRAAHGRSHLLGVFPQIAGAVLVLPRLPFLLAARQFGCVQVHIDGAGHCIDGDDVAVAQEPDRSAEDRFRTDMADAEAARGAGEAAVGD